MDIQVNPVKKKGLQIWFTNKYKGASGADLKSFLNRNDNKGWSPSATLKHAMPPGKTFETLNHEVIWSTYTVHPASLHPNCPSYYWLSSPRPYLVRVMDLASVLRTTPALYSTHPLLAISENLLPGWAWLWNPLGFTPIHLSFLLNPKCRKTEHTRG